MSRLYTFPPSLMPISSLIKSTTTSLQTLFWLRCLAIVGQSLTIVGVHWLLNMPLPLLPMLLTVVFLVIVNIYTARRLRQAQQGRVISEGFLAAQLSVDIMALAILLYCSGGAFNPFVSLFLLPLAIAAAILPLGYTVSLVILTIFLYASLMTDSIPLPPVPVGFEGVVSLHIFGMWINFVLSACLIAGFITYLSNKVRATDHQLARTRESNLRQEQVLALGTLAAGTAHELGTPLSTIAILAAELEAQAPEALREDLLLLSQQVSQCKQILSTMLQKVELAKTQELTLISAGQLLENVLEKFQILRPSIIVKAPVFARQGLSLVACDTTLEQALLNLLNNAADASSGSVEISLSNNNHKVIIDILDRGLGFPEEVLAQMGEEFITTKGEQGMGIGLFLANATLERLGGDIAFLARDGGGAIARVMLPIHRKVDEHNK